MKTRSFFSLSFLRKYHRLTGLVITLPLLVTTITGVILQLRGEFEFIQPKAVKSDFKISDKLISFSTLIQKMGAKNIDQIIWKPGKASLVVRLTNGEEAHLHPATGEILKQSPRRTGFLIELHQGSWMGKWGQYLVHFVAGLGLFFLIISGLLIYPFKKKNL